mmetsp:Transcript_50125/g.106593  ORF Transcript_50125/g.106593 Transcript_50125/m.106593 type:complete len:364 (-) Transcript_50125:87-1178(-)|eukprot:CAMPEP_0206541162 /NCGR_PEP_ID=MMETSP0325_2-20121206/9458_1 /ASSEMBLY_ACC=CAM_ASM_000347 /TAXON_ID=2866 /ORGANISM="Crypthecodinium cohnii, Strain Seligo" /LENGTH=363 /DNA_ID=CAMNT_0054039067 /DNA_START=18 /DNA_END=1109 /DNA_ORIENTATION=+
MAGFWERAKTFGRGPQLSPLQADLRRLTEAELLESPPPETLNNVANASHDEDQRREILLHMQECLAEPSSRRWRRVNGGLVLLDHLLRRGSPKVVTEIAEGRHFDPLQRLAFLEKFEFSDDKRVQNMLRQKATALRSEMMLRLQDPDYEPATSSGPGGTQGSGRDHEDRNGTSSASKYVGFGSDSPPGAEPKQAAPTTSSAYVGFGNDSVASYIGEGGKPKFVSNMVALGHNDDTTSESSGGEGNRRTGRKKKGSKSRSGGGNGAVLPPDRRKPLEDSTDSDDSRDHQRRSRSDRQSKNGSSKPAPAATAQEVDLLGGLNDNPPARPAPPKTEDLLDDIFGSSPYPQEQAKPAASAPKDLLDF